MSNRCLFGSFIFILTLFLLTFAGKELRADEIPQEDPVQNPQQDSPTQEATISDGAIRLFMDKIEVLGRLERPQAVYIVPGSNPEVDDIRINRDFFSEIFRSIEKGGRRSSTSVKKQTESRKDFIPW